MSRTIRKDKFGNKYPDGKKKKQKFYCNCWLCTGTGKQELQELKERIIDRETNKEIQNEYGGYYEPWAWDEMWEEYYDKRGRQTPEEWKNWEEYQMKQAA